MAYVEYEEDGKTIRARVMQKTDTEANWMVNDLPLLSGEQAFVVNDNGGPINFKIGDGEKTFAELPYWINGTNHIISSPFKVRVGDVNLSVVGEDTVVTDIRLVGKTDYVVTTTQLNNSAFRDDDLIFDSANGSVTILNFRLLSNEMLVIYPSGIPDDQVPDVSEIELRIAKLEQMMSPMLTGGRVWWTGGLPLPVGWVEDETWRDYTPIHAPSPGQLGLTVGSNTHTLTVPQLPKHSHPLSRPIYVHHRSFSGASGAQRPLKDEGDEIYMDKTLEVGDNQPFSLVQKSKYGMWIKYVGV